MHIPRVNFAALKLKNGSVILSGGATAGGLILNECELVGKQTKISNMNIKRMAHSMCQLGEYVYVFGGMDEKNTTLASVERIKLTESHQSHKWEHVCEMPVACCNSGLIVVNQG